MSQPNRAQLLGYLLGALEEPQHTAVAASLAGDPQWQEELQRLKGYLEPLAILREEFTPPAGLAARTCQFVIAQRHGVPNEAESWHVAARGQRAGAMPIRHDVPSPRGVLCAKWRICWLDLTMVLSIFVAAIALLLPALQSSRFRARLALCQDNLRELGLAAIRYSNTHHGYFPAVPREGKLAFAGVYAPTLLQSRLLDDARRIVCPDSPLASVSGFRLPSLKELEALPTEELTPMLPQIGGSYGYTLGHLHEGAYRDTRNLGRQWFALLADAPSGDRRQSVNHDGRGTNVLFEDGHVRFLQCPRLTSVADDFFANDEGQVAAGLHPNDSVIAPSATSPKTALPALPSPTP